MLILFFDGKGAILHKYVPEGQIVNATFYVQVLDRSWKRIARVRSEIGNAFNFVVTDFWMSSIEA